MAELKGKRISLLQSQPIHNTPPFPVAQAEEDEIPKDSETPDPAYHTVEKER